MKFFGRHLQTLVLGFIGWTVFGVFFALQNYVDGIYFGAPRSFWTNLIVWLICGYTWALLTPLVIYLSKEFSIRRGQVGRNVTIHLLAGGLISLFQLSIFIFVRQWLVGNPRRPFSFSIDFQDLFIGESHVNLLIYWIVVGIAHLRLIHRQSLERERETARLALETAQLETKLATAQLDALKMQIHPHFLFNTLNSISVLIRDDTNAANQMLLRLSELLRVVLRSDSSQEIPLRDELKFLRSYLEIEQTRFRDRLSVDFVIARDTLDAQVPNMILQPLVENAIRHGIAPRAEAGKLLIETKRNNGFVDLTVSDNGGGLSESPNESNGIGLKNTRERLNKLYGENQKFEIVSTSGDGSGLRVNIRIPFHTSEADGSK